MASNNWNGRDVGLRRLRVYAIFVISALLVYLIVVEPRPHDLGAIGTLLGAWLVLLGFEAGIRWPGEKP